MGAIPHVLGSEVFENPFPISVRGAVAGPNLEYKPCCRYIQPSLDTLIVFPRGHK